MSGQTRGPLASLARGGLYVLSLAFRGLTGVRNRLYDLGALRSTRVNAPVICIGNITAGGTGKTPLTLWLGQQALDLGFRPAILSRGYGGATEGDIRNDEGRLLDRKLQGAVILQGSDRVALATRALQERGCDLIILDDGFQHRRLQRDLDVVVIDATTPFGFGHMLPRGLLRESPTSLARAHVAILTRCEGLEVRETEQLTSKVRDYGSGNLTLLRAHHAPLNLRNQGGDRIESVDKLIGQKVGLVSAIGNPDAFESTVRDLGAEIVWHDRRRDHACYTTADVSRWRSFLEQSSASRILTTEKDSVKIGELACDLPWWALEIGMTFPDGPPAALLTFLETHRRPDGHPKA